MAHHLVLSPQANKDLKKLETSVKQRIDKALFELQRNPYVYKIKFLKERLAADFRIRVGDYRILYDVYDEEKVVYIIKIGHRKDIYR